jgi:hypothetical protein
MIRARLCRGVLRVRLGRRLSRGLIGEVTLETILGENEHDDTTGVLIRTPRVCWLHT